MDLLLMNDDIPQCGDPFEPDDRVGDLSFPKAVRFLLALANSLAQ